MADPVKPDTAPADRLKILQSLKQAGPRPAVKRPGKPAPPPPAEEDPTEEEMTAAKPISMS